MQSCVSSTPISNFLVYPLYGKESSHSSDGILYIPLQFASWSTEVWSFLTILPQTLPKSLKKFTKTSPTSFLPTSVYK